MPFNSSPYGSGNVSATSGYIIIITKAKIECINYQFSIRNVNKKCEYRPVMNNKIFCII